MSFGFSVILNYLQTSFGESLCAIYRPDFVRPSFLTTAFSYGGLQQDFRKTPALSLGSLVVSFVMFGDRCLAFETQNKVFVIR